MGILDEAIREHLELKRRSGAADSELKRMEDEAFGPPSRPGAPDFPEPEEASAHAGNGAATETTVMEAPSAPEAPIAPTPEAPPEPQEPEPQEDGDEDEGAGELGDEVVPIESLETVEHPFPDEITEPEHSEPDHEPEHLEPETDAPPAIDEPESPPHEDEEEPDEGEGDDVLADTPEFLKDAPEDDELWFEQGEPKDFDF